MGMNSSLYVGPYFHCQNQRKQPNLPVDALYEYHGESERKEKDDWYVPNRAPAKGNPPIGRTCHFDPNSDYGVLFEYSNGLEREMYWLESEFEQELKALQDAYEIVTVRWGVLTSVS